MSSSAHLLSGVDDFPLALRATLFLADGRASRLSFFGVGVSMTQPAWVAFVVSPHCYIHLLLPFHHCQFPR